MKHEDVPGYTDMRAELFRARFELQLVKTDEDIIIAKNRVKEIRKKIARALYDYQVEQQEKEVKKGR